MNKYNSKLTFIFLILILLRHIFNIPNIDFILVGLYSFLMFLIGKGNIQKKLAFILVFSVLSSERMSIGGINIRFEDFVTVLLVFCLLFNKNYKLKFDKVDFAIIIYLIYSAIVFFIAANNRITELKYIVIFIKEIQYFIYYYFLKCTLSKEKMVHEIFDIVTICTIFNVIWGLFQISKGMIGYYGIGCFSSPFAAHSGGIFLMLTIINAYIYNTTLNKKNLILCFLSILMTILTISRTNILGLFIFVLLIIIYKLFMIIKNNKLSKKISTIFLCLFIVGIAFYVMNTDIGLLYVNKLIDRFTRIDSASSIRYYKWGYYLNQSSLLGIVFGNGKGYPELIAGKGFTLATDSQYVCQILETGIVGLIIWLSCLLLASLWYKHPINISHRYSIYIVIIFLVMGITLEIFQSTLQASTFWIFMAILSCNKLVVDNDEIKNSKNT